ncbi:hypothetical protein ASE48_20145 [Mycobacterium sp. Root265]|uniref:hypothetical protein n=1 Tax=Mycobacterium sp. Root265 TaxID=1736504 RepID=UPI00070E6E0E|nr:hypothetical protein [Mycobacterium sp. Root265]KRD04954.1 hypothetical protein ASE48_20145 [Mycobacterium sp. Root265]
MTDPVLRQVVKQWLAELPEAERSALINEVGEPTPGAPAEPDPRAGIKSGQDLYRNNGRRTIEVEQTAQRTDYEVQA